MYRMKKKEEIKCDADCPNRDNSRHCWHNKNTQFSTGNPRYDVKHVICCFCGCDGIGYPFEVKGVDHGPHDPSVRLYYLYEEA